MSGCWAVKLLAHSPVVTDGCCYRTSGAKSLKPSAFASFPICEKPRAVRSSRHVRLARAAQWHPTAQCASRNESGRTIHMRTLGWPAYACSTRGGACVRRWQALTFFSGLREQNSLLHLDDAHELIDCFLSLGFELAGLEEVGVGAGVLEPEPNAHRQACRTGRLLSRSGRGDEAKQRGISPACLPSAAMVLSACLPYGAPSACALARTLSISFVLQVRICASQEKKLPRT